MKIRIGIAVLTGLLSVALFLPQFTYAQDNSAPPPDDSSQYQNPQDNPPDQNDQQLDAQEEQQTSPPSDQPVSTQVFYDQLSPYGQWVNNGSYGYVWIPSAVPNFVPYSTDGHWVYTDYGWTWVSDYPWGWATFHYGRWDFDNAYGWFWVPDVTWGPAWVCWRHSEGYYGWAPLFPGVNISAGYGWGNNIPANYWCFVNQRYIGDRYVWRHYEPRVNNVTFIRNSTVINNTYVNRGNHITYSSGPRREDVERELHTTIRPTPIHESARPEQRYDQAHLHLYKPNVSNAGLHTQPAPVNHVEMNQVPQRNVRVQPDNKTWNNAPKTETNWNRPSQAPQQRQQPMRQSPVQRSSPVQHSAPSGGGRSGGGGGGRHR